MHEVDVETDFEMHAYARDLLQSGYSETEVLDAINEQEIRIEQIPETDVEHFTETEEELITETQVGVEKVPETDVEQVPETDVEQVPETDAEEGLNVAPPSQRMVRKRKPSQRIGRIKLAKRVGGQGSTQKNPVTLE